LEKIARFKILESSSLQFQNDLAFLGRIGKPSFSEFPKIYDKPFFWSATKKPNANSRKLESFCNCQCIFFLLLAVRLLLLENLIFCSLQILKGENNLNKVLFLEILQLLCAQLVLAFISTASFIFSD
jgi:hypothetical protein